MGLEPLGLGSLGLGALGLGALGLGPLGLGPLGALWVELRGASPTTRLTRRAPRNHTLRELCPNEAIRTWLR